MDTTNIELQAANTLLERGIRFAIPSPWWLRMFGKKSLTIVIRHPYLITLYWISNYYLKMGIDAEKIAGIGYDQAFDLVKKNSRYICSIVAAAWLNNHTLIKLFARPVSSYLINSLTPVKLYTIYNTLVNFSGIEAFMSTIRLASVMKTTTPKNLSPTETES